MNPGPGYELPFTHPSDMSRVAIISGSYGAGHDAAARELARQFRQHGCHVDTYDVADLLPVGIGRLLRAGYTAQMRSQPKSWDLTLRMVEPGHRLHSIVTRSFSLAARRVLAAIEGVDVVVSTHPFASQVLGAARRSGKLKVPAVTYLTDASVHALWLHPGIDLNLGICEVAAESARRGGNRAMAITPVVREVVPAGSCADPLAEFEIDGPRVLVTTGSLGIGDVEATALDIIASGLATPVVACGSNEVLLKRLSRIPGVIALGWREDMPEIIASSDCVVQNAGGFTVLETLAAGTPIITYRPLPGHGTTNSRNLAEAGLVPWPKDQESFAAELESALAGGHRPRFPESAPSVFDALVRPVVTEPVTA